MFKGLKFCCATLIFIVIVIFLVVKGLFSSSSDMFDTLKSYFIDKEEPKIVYVPQEEIRLSIIEGWKNKDIAQALIKKGLINNEEEFVEAQKKDYSQEFSFLKDKPKNSDLEGYLYPDTYLFHASSTPEEIITKMLENFNNKLTAKMRNDISAQGKTISEIMTMASLVEKEAPIFYSTGDNEDAKIIAGVFWNRIKSGQALQSCATLAYILGVNKAQYSEADTKIKSPYNTYMNPGLPPTPISNPGILAIEAAIYPTSNNYNYFLTPSGTNNIVYARTYEEHLSNKRKYLK